MDPLTGHPQSRDYFLGLPSPDLASMIPIEAKYADAVAMSQALSMSLEIFGQKIFTCEIAATFWLQHSDRAVLSSLAGVLADINEGGLRTWGAGRSPLRMSTCGLICSVFEPFSVEWRRLLVCLAGLMALLMRKRCVQILVISC